LKQISFNAQEQDQFIYLDAGTELKAPLDFVQNWLHSNDCLFFSLPNKIGDWTTKICLAQLDACGPRFTEADQIHANVMAFRPTKQTKQLFGEWEFLMREIGIAGPITRLPRPDGELSRCVAHRADQSVLSILLVRRGLNDRLSGQQAAKHVDWLATESQVILCHRMPSRTCALRASTWLSLVVAGIVPRNRAWSLLPFVCLVKTPRQSFVWVAKNHGKWGVGKKIRALRSCLSIE